VDDIGITLTGLGTSPLASAATRGASGSGTGIAEIKAAE
jgi:hypothetical protein